MDNLTIAKHLRVLRQEIADIMAQNWDYSASTQHCTFDSDLHNKRRRRLEEIKEELADMQRRSAASTSGVIALSSSQHASASTKPTS